MASRTSFFEVWSQNKALQKIIFVSLVPIVVLGILASFFIWDKVERCNEASFFHKNNHLLIHALYLNDALQQERKSVLSTSTKKASPKEMQYARAKTDNAWREFELAFADHPLPEGIKREVIESRAEWLSARDGQADKKKTEIAWDANTRFYSAVYKVVAYLPSLKTSFGMGKRQFSVVYLELLKEKMQKLQFYSYMQHNKPAKAVCGVTCSMFDGVLHLLDAPVVVISPKAQEHFDSFLNDPKWMMFRAELEKTGHCNCCSKDTNVTECQMVNALSARLSETISMECEALENFSHKVESDAIEMKIKMIFAEVIGLITLSGCLVAIQILLFKKNAAQLADKAKMDFLAMMSHEIRTPMNAVIGFTNILLDTPVDTQQREYLKIIESSGGNLLSLINDILDYSKIESGRIEIESHPFSLFKCVEDVLDLNTHTAGVKNLELAYAYDGDVPSWVSGDVSRLRQVLVNLVSNAVKFTPRGEVDILISRQDDPSLKKKEKTPDDGREKPVWIRFEVRDSGIGISDEAKDILFRPFCQADSSVTRLFGGTGLGLAISKRLVQLMGGNIDFTSEQGKGTTFFFVIPFMPTPEPESDSRAETEWLVAGKQVLIVDDNEINRRALIAQLQRWKMRCQVAASGQEALALLQKGMSFDMAVLDMMMPGMSGLDLAKQIRSVPALKEMPLLMLSSIGYNEMVKVSEHSIFDAILDKPIHQSRLYNEIVCLLKGHHEKRLLQKAVFTGDDQVVSQTEDGELDAGFSEKYPLRILVAEDHPVNIRLIIHILSKMGYHPDTAGNGREAAEMVTRKAYDTIFMDVEMPVMNGLDASKRIREMERMGMQTLGTKSKHIQIIALTAHVLQGDREKCLDAGMDDYLSKPVNISKLKNALKQSLEKKNA